MILEGLVFGLVPCLGGKPRGVGYQLSFAAHVLVYFSTPHPKGSSSCSPFCCLKLWECDLWVFWLNHSHTRCLLHTLTLQPIYTRRTSGPIQVNVSTHTRSSVALQQVSALCLKYARLPFLLYADLVRGRNNKKTSKKPRVNWSEVLQPNMNEERIIIRDENQRNCSISWLQLTPTRS